MSETDLTSRMRLVPIVGGIVIMLIGVGLLFVTFHGQTEVKWDEFSFSTPYPGLVVLLAGLILAGLGVTGRWPFGGEKSSSNELAPAVTDQATAIRILVEQLADKKPTSAQAGGEGPPDAGPPEMTPEVRAAAELLLQRGEAKDKARAAVVKGDFEAADRYLAEAMKPVLADAFELLTIEGDRYYYAGEFDKAVGPYEKALGLRPGDFTARHNAAIAHCRARLGSIAEHRGRAIEIMEGTLEQFPRQTHPVEWAMTQNNMALAYLSEMPGQERCELLRRAIEACEKALTVYMKQAHPVEWAATHYNMALALADLSEMPEQERCELLRRAIASGKAAMVVWTAEGFPEWHAMARESLEIYRRAYEVAGCGAEVGFDEIEAAE